METYVETYVEDLFRRALSSWTGLDGTKCGCFFEFAYFVLDMIFWNDYLMITYGFLLGEVRR